jgi:hypothetical protein
VTLLAQRLCPYRAVEGVRDLLDRNEARARIAQFSC